MLSRSRSTYDHYLTNLVGPTSQMLHTKSQGHQPPGSGEKLFKKKLPYMGMSAV